MSGWLPETIYPDHAWCGPTEVVENVEIARDTYRVRFGCPQLAAEILPGQFSCCGWPERTIRCWAARWRCTTWSSTAGSPGGGRGVSGRGQADPAAGCLPGGRPARSLGAVGQRVSTHRGGAPCDGCGGNWANAFLCPGPGSLGAELRSNGSRPTRGEPGDGSVTERKPRPSWPGSTIFAPPASRYRWRPTTAARAIMGW